MKHKKTPRERRLSRIFGKVIRILLPIGVSAGLVVWLLHKVDIHEMMQMLRHDVDYTFIIIMMLLTMLSHIIRGIRWGIQLRGAGLRRLPVVEESVSIFGAYALNLVVTYLGEAWRCVFIARQEKAKLSTVVGTDFGDRISDLVVIVLLTGLAMIVAHPQLEMFLDKYQFGKELESWATSGKLWLSILFIVAVAIWADRRYRHTRLISGINASLKRIWDGFAVLFTMKGKGMYAILTVGIWTCYFLETYSCFYAFPFTKELISEPGSCWGLLPGLVVFVFGSCSMAVPSSGGLGPWNVAVVFALTLYGVGREDATMYSLVCWSFQALMLVMLGIFAATYVMWLDRKEKKHSLP